MWRRVPVLLAFLLVLAVPAGARASVLYTTLDQPNDVTGTNAEFTDGSALIAQAFTPTTGGTARLMSIFAQTNIGTGPGTIQLSVWSDGGGVPGTLLAVGQGTVAGDTTGASPTCLPLGP